MSIWKTPDESPKREELVAWEDRNGMHAGRFDTCYNCFFTCADYRTDLRKAKKWCSLENLEDLIAAADRADQLQVELDETKKALLRDFEIRNDCLTKILESYLNFAGFVRAYPNVPNLTTFRAGNIIYDWSPVLEFMKNGRTDRALERLKAIEPDQICPKCGEKMTETMLLSLPPQTQYRCYKCGYIEIKKRTYSFSAGGVVNPIQEKTANEILSKIPDGYRYDSMESLETKDGEIIIRITTKRDDDGNKRG